jgi:hypothetical protein
MSTAITAGITGINAGLTDLLARLSALQSFRPLPFSFAAQLDIAQKTLASVQASISAGLPEPSIAAQLAAIAALIAELAALVAGMQAQLAIITQLQARLTVAGIAAYAFDGARDALGAELGAAVGPGSMHANALALVTTDPAAWSALSVVLKVR